MQYRKYKPARLGLGTESSRDLQPLDFSPDIVNRFYNLLGDLEKRPGLTQFGEVVNNLGTPLNKSIISLHEYVDTSGNSTYFAQVSAVTTASGALGIYNASANQWVVNDTNTSFIANPGYKLYSVQMGDKLIFCNGVNRNFYYSKSNPFSQFSSTENILHSVVTKGITSSGTTTTKLEDGDVTNWRTQTNVAANDLVEIQTAIASGTFVQAYGVVTSVGTTSIDMTVVGTAATGIGFQPNLTTMSNQPYRIFDLVELNIFPQGANLFNDNVAVGGAQTSANAIAVTGFSFLGTEIRAGDIVYNTTRAAVTKVLSVSANIAVTQVNGQTAGDSFVFLKEAMPIASFPHVHYGRLHLIDARDPTKIRVSGPNDPEDFTTFSKTLSSVTIDYGTRQPKGDILLTMNTFQRYLVVGGRQALYATEATNPIADVTADVVDLDPVGLMPQGVVSTLGIQSIGGEELYIARDGLRSFTAAFDAKNTNTTNRSEQIKSELIQVILNELDTPDQMQLIHYPRRNWVIMKIGDNMYNWNYTPTYQLGEFSNFGTITRFRGLMAEQDAFLLRRDGLLLTGDSNGKIYSFDNDSSGTDDGVNIFTQYTSPWHTLQEGVKDVNIYINDGRYVKPVFESYGQINYTISVVGNYDQLSTDEIVVTAQGAAIVGIGTVGTAVINNTAITNPKLPLRWRGEQFQITIETDTSVAGDIINSYTIYGNICGRK